MPLKSWYRDKTYTNMYITLKPPDMVYLFTYMTKFKSITVTDTAAVHNFGLNYTFEIGQRIANVIMGFIIFALVSWFICLECIQN